MKSKEGALIFTVLILLIGIMSLFSLYVRSTLLFLQLVNNKKEYQLLEHQTQTLMRCGIYFCKDCFDSLEHLLQKKDTLQFCLSSFAPLVKNNKISIALAQEKTLRLVAEARNAVGHHSISVLMKKIVETTPTGTFIHYELNGWHNE